MPRNWCQKYAISSSFGGGDIRIKAEASRLDDALPIIPTWLERGFVTSRVEKSTGYATAAPLLN
ncbi:hypothetical protein SK128_027608 [Halocaridina rubra]|uniref:Uncharacterized protein n=1 Tax=Halocaridina rubra TaxID=373956 RepID=A0AAN9A6X9_HALRR